MVLSNTNNLNHNFFSSKSLMFRPNFLSKIRDNLNNLFEMNKNLKFCPYNTSPKDMYSFVSRYKSTHNLPVLF